MGYGESGRAVHQALSSHRGYGKSEFAVVEDGPTGDSIITAPKSVAPVFIGDTAGYLRSLGEAWPSITVVSPGVRPTHPLVLSGDAVMGEVELAYRLIDLPIIGVTGTNGKTTTVTMISEMLGATIDGVALCGNVGTPMISVQDASLMVVELSSFQLLYTSEFRCEVAAWTNLASDHLDYHGSADAYKSAKERIWMNQLGDDLRVINLDDPGVVTSRRSGELREIGVSLEGRGAYFLRGDELVGPGGAIAHRSELRRDLPHELSNMLMAAACAESKGADRAAVRDFVLRYAGYAHRIELIGTHLGVRYYDDSKATTPASVSAALSGFRSVVLIAGGRNKGLDLSELTRNVHHLSAVVAIGECAAEIVELFSSYPQLNVTSATSMSMAVSQAAGLAKSGDVILLSPGTASFDWYPNYKARGDDFRRSFELYTKVGL